MAYITKINVKGTTYDIKDDNAAHNFADIYDPTHSEAYAQGDLVVYDGTLYKAKNTIASPPGAFDADKWAEVTVEGEFKRVQTAVSDPDSSSTATSFIATASQNTQGVISVTKKGLPFSSTTPVADGTGSAGSANTIARGDHVHPKGPATTANTLATARRIDGVSFNGSADIIHYAECTTAANTALKLFSVTGFPASASLAAGARIAVKFTNGNTAAAIQFNIAEVGATKSVYYEGAATTAANANYAVNSVHEFIYDGTRFNYVGYYGKGDISAAINALDYTATGLGTNKTITTLTQVNGLISASASNIAIDASQVTSGTLPVTRGGTGSGGDVSPFLGDSIIVSNADGSALVSDNTISMAEFHALDGVKTDQTIQDQIDAITGGGTDHVRYLNEVPVWVVADESYHFTNEKVINGYNASTNPNGYKTDVGDLVVGLDMSLGVVTSKAGSEGVYTYEAEYKGILKHMDATYTSSTETLNLIWMAPTLSTVTP